MDQSTQVNFPIVNLQQKIHKHHTYGDLYRQQNLYNKIYRKPNRNRPKSINIPLKLSNGSLNNFPNNYQHSQQNYHQFEHRFAHESFQPTTIHHQDHHQHQNHHSLMMNYNLNSINHSREGESPFSSNSSVISTIYNHNRQPQTDDGATATTTTSTKTGNCKCCFNSPKGLSWRRLHMSRAKLKATATTSELLSGFAMVAMVELQINEPTNVPEWLFILFAICTTILVSVHIFALMISTYILPNIDAIAKLDNYYYNINDIIEHSPHEYMKNFIELAWAFSTILGLFLFLVEIAILCWVKFWDYSFNAAIASTIVIIPILVIFVFFSLHFYQSLLVYKSDSSINDIKQLDEIKKQLDDQTNTSPV